MPSYPKGTRQWAEAQLLMLETMQAEDYCPSRDADIHDLMEELGSLPDGAPAYSRAELEAAGQEVMF